MIAKNRKPRAKPPVPWQPLFVLPAQPKVDAAPQKLKATTRKAKAASRKVDAAPQEAKAASRKVDAAPQEAKAAAQEVKAAPQEGSFHASLVERMQAEIKRRVSSSPWPQRLRQMQVPRRGILSRVWSSLQARYRTSAAKRLRVHETVSLGEKRFVAILSVEGREFLIGGGAAGVSLLTSLGTTPGLEEELGKAGGIR